MKQLFRFAADLPNRFQLLFRLFARKPEPTQPPATPNRTPLDAPGHAPKPQDGRTEPERKLNKVNVN